MRSGKKSALTGPSTATLRRSRLVLALSSLSMLALLLSSNSASACPLTNPQCAVEKVKSTTEEVKATADETVDHLQDQANETVEKVNNTVDNVKGTADGALGNVKETVEGTITPGGNGGGGSPTTPDPPKEPKVDDPKKPVDKGETEGKTDTKGSDASSGERNRRNDDRRERGDRRGDASDRPVRAPVSLASDRDEQAAGDVLRQELAPGLGESAIEAIKDFAFPLILSFIVGAFLVAQHRVDRKEPKLLFAPIDQDLMSFE